MVYRKRGGSIKVDLGGGGKGGKKGTVNLNDNCDVKHDINIFPYPFKTNSISYLTIIHTLEHLKEPFLVMKEIYRICKNQAVVEVEVPYWKQDFPSRNPAHKHIFSEEWFRNLSKDSPVWWGGMSDSCGVNFRVVKVIYSRYGGSKRFWERHKMRVIMKVIK